MRRLLLSALVVAVLTLGPHLARLIAATTVFHDQFTEGANTVLPSTTVDPTGTSWELGEDTTSGNGEIEVVAVTDQARGEATAASQRYIALANTNPALGSADYTVQVNYVTEAGTTDDPFILIVRWASSSSYYAAVFQIPSQNPDCAIGKITTSPGGWTILGAAGDCNIAAGDTAKLQVSGSATTTLKIFDQTGELLSRDDSSSPITAAGKPGLGMGALWVATDDVTNVMRLDEFMVLDDTAAASANGPRCLLLGVC